MARRTRRKSSRHRRSRNRRTEGGGWSLDPSKFVSAGYLENTAYTGTGKDCADTSFARPGHISGHTPSGMPGMSGGRRKARRSQRKRGGYQLAVAPMDPPSYFPSTSGAGGTVGAPGVPQHAVQKGGRYEMNPGSLLSNGSDIGMSSYSVTSSIGCERGSTNSLNMGTGSTMRGGAQLAGAPTVAVGAADSMRIYSPTAGYGHGFQTFPGTSAVGGLMLNTPYDARAYNPACSKTGGGNVAESASPYSAAQMELISNRNDFDGSKGGLPVKYGGRRRSRKHRKHSRK